MTKLAIESFTQEEFRFCVRNRRKKFQMLFEQNIASNVTRNAGAQTYKT